VSGIRAAAFACHYEVVDHGRVAVTGSTRLVPFDFGIDRPRRLTAEDKEFLAQYADQSAEEKPLPPGPQ
jgi:acyl-CoA thioester hydrolase